jgi:hypothetical protein
MPNQLWGGDWERDDDDEAPVWAFLGDIVGRVRGMARTENFLRKRTRGLSRRIPHR